MVPYYTANSNEDYFHGSHALAPHPYTSTAQFSPESARLSWTGYDTEKKKWYRDTDNGRRRTYQDGTYDDLKPPRRQAPKLKVDEDTGETYWRDGDHWVYQSGERILVQQQK